MNGKCGPPAQAGTGRCRNSALLTSVLIAVLGGCDRGPDRNQTPSTPAAASRATREGDAPETHAIVAREGDHLVVIVDLALRDAKGRNVGDTKVDVDAPESAVKVTPPVRSADRITFEVRVPAATRSVKVLGSSEGGATWSTTISTDLAR